MSVYNWCNCGKVRSILELYDQEKVYQFLMGMNRAGKKPAQPAKSLRPDPNQPMRIYSVYLTIQVGFYPTHVGQGGFRV